MYKIYSQKLRLLFENFSGDRVALDRWWPRREGTSLDVNSYTHDWGANGSKPIHMQHFYRNVDACSSENNPSLHLCICAGVGARLCLHSTEMSDRVAWFRSAQAQKVHRGMKRSTEGDSGTKIPKAGPEQRLNPFMRGLFLCCEWQYLQVANLQHQSWKILKAAAHCVQVQDNKYLSQTFAIATFSEG